MCAIFGLLDYKGVLRHKKRLTLFRALSLAAQVRGTDATGAAWLERGEIHIQKAPKPAQRMRFRFPDEARAVIGHTRMTTQGPAEKNYNNHPFLGSAGKHQFALAHNGVISNEKALGWKYHFPVTQIETDSYVAVQLLQQQGSLGLQSVSAMAEDLEGSFTITILDDRGGICFVKGNNPLSIYHFPEQGIYLYASTQEILNRALRTAGISWNRQTVWVNQGELLRIDCTGEITRGRFNDSRIQPDWNRCWAPYPMPAADEAYLSVLGRQAEQMGIPAEEIQELYQEGYDLLDLEDMIYGGEYP